MFKNVLTHLVDPSNIHVEWPDNDAHYNRSDFEHARQKEPGK